MKKYIFYVGILFCFCFGIYAKNIENFRDKVVQQQIFLDEQNFSTGKIDGHRGKFTKQAWKYHESFKPLYSEMDFPLPYTVYLQKKVLVNDNFNLEEAATKSTEFTSIFQCYKLPQPKPLNSLYTFYTIKDDDKNYLGSIPEKIRKQAKKKALPYENLAEFIAERFHTDVDFLKEINPHVNFNKLKPNDRVKVPNVTPFVIESLTQTGVSKHVPLPKRIVKINTRKKTLLVFENNKIIAFFPITPGSQELPAPKGKWKIKSIRYLPWFRYDKRMLKEGKQSDNYHNLPPGPNSPVGVVWIGLNKKGIGIHGTNEPETIGRSTSHGCIRLTNWDVVKLSKLIKPGMIVEIN
ncbi:L,D-transpeptidase [Legionella gresilensis]|uniref:L,D-transpeptidase n=1 Tax=Legionella gresilensis TaxID=91823 RepID=UPI0010416202|nr:L,D-transpeptidase [Legionella gresilensis]